MVKKNLETLATMLHEARTKAQSVPQLSKNGYELSRSEAYQVQELQTGLRNRQDEKVIGWKMGLTSEAKRQQMNLDSPLYGVLTDKMQVSNGGVFSLKNTIHPKIEPEVAFLISKDLKGTVTREQVLESCSGIAACMEILDSRYDQFKYFSMEDVIADNSSSSHFVVGEWVRDFKNIDLMNLKMEMFADGALAQSGISKDISGDPVISVIQLVEMLGERNQTLKAGSIVLAGAATTAIPLTSGLKVKLEVQGLKPVTVSVGDQ